ncbi:AAA family ATPase [Clostridium beijerinckii]|uniref:AAA family ATPase n=1 Tax=Clostridium beijerinckii TaxID=1520 RepID=UPI00242F7FC1|nr:AAA family ATPase [Clostridium beijerinckii]MDG5856537.1 AAA family ATPase [Clostridium beijerinckii]
MEKVALLEYDRRNMRKIEEYIDEHKLDLIVLNPNSIINKLMNKKLSIQLNESYFYDITQILISNEGRSDLWSTEVIGIFNSIAEQSDIPIRYIIDKRYSNDVKEILYHYVDKIDVLEEYIGIYENNIFNIADIIPDKFNELKQFFKEQLFGNEHFQKRLFEELQKYRLFNKIDEQKVFSVFICGKSGIGKTETARILHKFLARNEKFIKINLGNYGDKNALSSLIGSPRGYIGSSKGELSDKIFKSKSKVILIDEFEKAGPQVHNFFLELLEDGKFTDSLGREFDLNKYIIIFTSNIKKEDVEEKISPELRSRFNLMYRFSEISNKDKESYIEYKSNKLLEKIKCKLGIEFSEEEIKEIKNININQYDNLRNINKEIMLKISNKFESKEMGIEQ